MNKPFWKGAKDGLPICLGYVSVSFVFGMMCVESGLPAWVGILISMTNLTSAGQFAGLIGLIPNCAASVILTELHLAGALSLGAMFSGLLVGAGVGLLILFRTNRHLKQHLLILLTLYAIGVSVGILFDLTGLSALLSLV